MPQVNKGINPGGCFCAPSQTYRFTKNHSLIGLILHKTNIVLGIDAIAALSYGHKSVLSDYKTTFLENRQTSCNINYSPQPLSKHTATIIPTYQKCKVKMTVMLALSFSLMAYI